MKINYKINKQKHKITFCPDNQGLKIKKKKKSYMLLSKDLKKNYSGQKVLIVFDKINSASKWAFLMLLFFKKVSPLLRISL